MEKVYELFIINFLSKFVILMELNEYNQYEYKTVPIKNVDLNTIFFENGKYKIKLNVSEIK